MNIVSAVPVLHLPDVNVNKICERIFKKPNNLTNNLLTIERQAVFVYQTTDAELSVSCILKIFNSVATYTVFAFGDLANAELFLTGAHFLLSLELVVNSLSFSHWFQRLLLQTV